MKISIICIMYIITIICINIRMSSNKYIKYYEKYGCCKGDKLIDKKDVIDFIYAIIPTPPTSPCGPIPTIAPMLPFNPIMMAMMIISMAAGAIPQPLMRTSKVKKYAQEASKLAFSKKARERFKTLIASDAKDLNGKLLASGKYNQWINQAKRVLTTTDLDKIIKVSKDAENKFQVVKHFLIRNKN